MKISCEKKELLKGINIVMKAISGKAQLPIQRSILIKAEKGGLTLIAKDNELGIETFIDCVIDEIGSIAIDAKVFSDIVRGLDEENIVITSNENFMANIVCGRTNYNINCLDPESFELLKKFEKVNKIVIPKLLLKNAINMTIFSVAINGKNKIMSGELFKVSENKLTLVSLDGSRVSKKIVECETEGEFLENIIIPGKSLTELSKILDDDSKTNVEIYCYNQYVSFEFDSTKILTRLIDGEYFNIDPMLNIESEIKVNVNRKDLSSLIDRSLFMIRENDKKPVVIELKESILNLSIQTAIGSLDEEIDIKKDGNDLIVGLNPKYLLDILKSVDDEFVDIYFNGSKAPCIIKDKEETYIYLVMPINLKRDI